MTTAANTTDPVAGGSIFAPLRHGVFPRVWFASLGTSFGGLIQPSKTITGGGPLAGMTFNQNGAPVPLTFKLPTPGLVRRLVIDSATKPTIRRSYISAMAPATSESNRIGVKEAVWTRATRSARPDS